MSLLRAAGAVSCAALMFPLLAAADPAARTYRLSIDAPDLSQALLTLGRQAQISIVFPKAATERVQPPKLEGEFELAEALERLIGGTCLRASFVTERLVAVRSGCAAPASESGTGRHEPRLAAGPETGSAPPVVEEVLVSERYLTGSRIRVPAFSGATQVDIIERPDIELAGAQSIGELLRFLPSVAGNSTSTLVSNGGDGTATVTLRGLPASNTLVLINGRRTNPDPFLGRSVDLNTVPIGLIERIEVLKDGASAIYGSDAIAGVVNLITHDRALGAHLESSYGDASRGDLDTTNVSLTYGTELELGNALLHANVGGSYYEQEAIFSRDRALSRSSDDRPRGGIDKRSSATSPARLRLPDRPVILAANTLDGTDPSHFRTATNEDLFEYREHTSSVVPSERVSLFANVDLELAGGYELYVESLFTDTKATNTLAPTPLLTGFEARPLVVSAQNAYNPFGIDLTDVRRRFTELAAREQSYSTETQRLVLGVRGTLGSARWDLSVAGNRTQSEEKFDNLIHATRTALALGPRAGCTGDCVPLNVFGPPGSITPEMLRYLEVDAENDGESSLRTLALNFDFPWLALPGGRIEVASGIEYRKEQLTTEPDPLVRSGETIGGANHGPTHGDRYVLETYAEALLPLLAERPFADLLDVQVAGRVSRYSDFGYTTNPRVALRWRPTPSLMMRGSYSEGFRAPTLHQLFLSESQSFELLNDPCAVSANVGALPGCNQLSDTTLIQFLTIEGGNRALRPEQASTHTIGLVLTPASLPGFDASLDYYWISARNVVDASAQFIVNENARSGRLSDRVIRDEHGNLQRVYATMLNIGERDVSGIDLRLAYRSPELPFGNVDLALNATQIRSFKDQFDPGSRTTDHAGTFTDEASSGNGALPDWKANLGVTWRQNGWQASYTVHLVSELDERLPELDSHRRIEDWQTHNVQLSYFGPHTYWTRVSIGANNVFDEAPPFSAVAFNDSYDPRTYDITGRYLYAQIVKDL